MPLLPLEPYIYPADLLNDGAGNGASSPGDPAPAWWVLHTRPRAEKALARKFFGKRMGFFLPLYKKQWRNRGRLLSSHAPLFPGYVFLYGDADDRLRALETNQVAQVLTVPDPVELRSDLVRVYRVMLGNMLMTPEDYLQPGTEVEIIHGALEGVRGKVLRRGKELRFVVEVHFLQRGVSVEVESSMIRPISA